MLLVMLLVMPDMKPFALRTLPGLSRGFCPNRLE